MINEQIYSDVTIAWEEYDEPLASGWLLEPRVSLLFLHLLCDSQRRPQTEWRKNLIAAQEEVFKVVRLDVRSLKVLKLTTNEKKTHSEKVKVDTKVPQ